MYDLIKLNEVKNVLQELEEAYFDIPFENSKFQNEMFVIASQITPARAYRSIGLRLSSKIRAIKEYMFSRETNAIDLEENEYLMSLEETSSFEKKRLEIKNKQIIDSQKYSEKLLNDALHEISFLYSQFKKLPKYTREQFEQEEELHYHLDLEQNHKIGSSYMGSLVNMSVNHDMLNKMIEDPKMIENLKEQSEKILQSPEWRNICMNIPQAGPDVKLEQKM
jgi:hypothetical protein